MRWVGRQWGTALAGSQHKHERLTVVQNENLVGGGGVGYGWAGREKGSLFYVLIKLCELILYNS